MTESPDQVGGDRVTSPHQSTGAEWRRVTQDIPGLVNLLAVALVKFRGARCPGSRMKASSFSPLIKSYDPSDSWSINSKYCDRTRG